MSCCVPTLPHTSNPHEQETGLSWGREDSPVFSLKILWFLPHLSQGWPYQETHSRHTQVILGKPFRKQHDGVAAASRRTRGQLETNVSHFLPEPPPADPQGGLSPSLKLPFIRPALPQCACRWAKTLPCIFFIVCKSESVYDLLKVKLLCVASLCSEAGQ